MAKTQIATTDAPAAAEAPAKGPQLWYVVDTTVQIDAPRTHEQIVAGRITPFKFEAATPLAMAPAIALKFLKHPAFIRTDADGKEIAYERAPKQPEELGAGEKLILKDNESIARYDELSTAALMQRAAVLPDGEKFASGTKPDREEMIAFITAFKLANRKANAAKEPERAKDEYDPGADDLEDAA